MHHEGVSPVGIAFPCILEFRFYRLKLSDVCFYACYCCHNSLRAGGNRCEVAGLTSFIEIGLIGAFAALVSGMTRGREDHGP